MLYLEDDPSYVFHFNLAARVIKILHDFAGSQETREVSWKTASICALSLGSQISEKLIETSYNNMGKHSPNRPGEDIPFKGPIDDVVRLLTPERKIHPFFCPCFVSLTIRFQSTLFEKLPFAKGCCQHSIRKN